MMYRRYGKRFLDLAVALPVLVLLSPVLAVIAVLVVLDSRGPLLFTQDRLGQHGRVFRMYKFRTMTNRPRTPTREIIGRDPEVTRVGFWLRRFKLDELPQLFNVLQGDMSLVGPRPGVPQQLADYDEVGRRRLLVRPGLTGLAQVHGNIHLSWRSRWYYDSLYVDRLSLPLDIWILWRTVAVLVRGEDRFLQQPPESDEASLQ